MIKNKLAVAAGMFTVLFLISCHTSRLIYETRVDESKVRFFLSNSLQSKKPLCKFYASVDSSNVQMIYNFAPDAIYKVYHNKRYYWYKLVTGQHPAVPMTEIDRFVLHEATNLLDSMGLKNAMRPDGATGFVLPER